jgi:N-acetylmuramoyl-L-alanine amidase
VIRATGVTLALLAAVLLVPRLVDSERPIAAEAAPALAPAVPARVPVRTTGRTAAKPLAGITIALDPGHQLGNHRFPAKINKQVPAGGFTKPCNTTGTATNSGYPEATLNFAIAVNVRTRLEKLGATVRLTRNRNSQSLWGPCVDARGKFGEKVGARLTVSLHADGARANGRGFHVIAPTSRKPWTTDIAAASLRLAKALRAGLDGVGLARSNYLGAGKALMIRSDLGTLNLSDVPVAMIEIGNMRNASDAKRMKTAAGRSKYARAVVAGIRAYLHR